MAQLKNGKRSLEADAVDEEDLGLYSNINIEDINIPKQNLQTVQFEEGECDYQDAAACIAIYQKQAMNLTEIDGIRLRRDIINGRFLRI